MSNKANSPGATMGIDIGENGPCCRSRPARRDRAAAKVVARRVESRLANMPPYTDRDEGASAPII
jgi:hypothetical protein